MTRPRVLLVDDDAAIRTVIGEAMRREGYEVETLAALGGMNAAIARHRPDVLITDVLLPDGNGFDALPDLRARHPGLPVIVISALNTLTTAVRAAGQGAFEYLPKPFDLAVLASTVRDALAVQAQPDEPVPAPAESELPLIGRSPAMQDVYRLIARVLTNDLTVLVLGESGTGKELVARAIHDLGPRRAARFVDVNMAAIPRDLIEAELFGHERGAFTGASASAIGRFEQADGGTLFLDEIGDMPPEAQTRLLRVLQTGEFTSVGGRTVRVDARVIAATHKHLPALIEAGLFREDLYYRLNVVPIRLPPLRERGEDIVALARTFLERAAAQGLPRRRLSTEAAARLTTHDWPGNVRELDNLMRRLAATARDTTIPAALVDEQLGQARNPTLGEEDLAAFAARWLARYFVSFGGDLPPAGLHARVLTEVERPLIAAAMRAVRGNQVRAAALLGINRNTLRKRLNELALAADDR